MSRPGGDSGHGCVPPVAGTRHPTDSAGTAATPAPDLAGHTALVVTASTRAATGVYPDRGGALLVSTLREWGMRVPDATVVPDGPELSGALRAGLDAGPDLLLTTGGTGLTPSDGTPEATAPLLDRDIPGIAEALRAKGVAAGIPTAVLSRGLAGLAGRTLVVNLPGSTGGVRDALEVLAQILPHALSQIGGGDH